MSINCKVCGGEQLKLWGKSDSNANLHYNFGPGLEIDYVICEYCGFLCTYNFDHWTKQDFLDNIYNEDYIKVDPEYAGVRPHRVAKWFMNYEHNKDLSILDFGAGNSSFAEYIKQHGYKAESYDPMWEINVPQEWYNNKFDLITAFEVFEHTPDPKGTVLQILLLLKITGKVLFSTMVTESAKPLNEKWWYLCPRGGHISHHSYKSLKELFRPYGLTVEHINEGMHLAYFE